MEKTGLWEEKGKRWADSIQLEKPGLILSPESLRLLFKFLLFKFQGNCHPVPACLLVLTYLLMKPGR